MTTISISQPHWKVLQQKIGPHLLYISMYICIYIYIRTLYIYVIYNPKPFLSSRPHLESKAPESPKLLRGASRVGQPGSRWASTGCNFPVWWFFFHPRNRRLERPFYRGFYITPFRANWGPSCSCQKRWRLFILYFLRTPPRFFQVLSKREETNYKTEFLLLPAPSEHFCKKVLLYHAASTMFPGDTCLWYLSSLDPVFFVSEFYFHVNNRWPAKRVNYKSNFQHSGHLGSAGSRPPGSETQHHGKPCKFRRIFSHEKQVLIPYNVHNLCEISHIINIYKQQKWHVSDFSPTETDQILVEFLGPNLFRPCISSLKVSKSLTTVQGSCNATSWGRRWR